jgi:hypothetical protein
MLIAMLVAGGMVAAMAGGASQASAQSAGCGGLLEPACPPTPQCRDGVDNDRDGAIDSQDRGCATRDDTSEDSDVAPDPGGNSAVDVNPRTSGKLFGFNTFLGSWYDSKPSSSVTSTQEADLIHRVGGNAQRLSVDWQSIEPERGRFNSWAFDILDRAYAALTARNMQPIMMVWDAPTWASDYGSCSATDPYYVICLVESGRQADRRPPRDVAAWGAFLRRLADRYPKAAFETWNEPNLKVAWNAPVFPDPGRMAAMQCAAYDAVKAAGRGQRVLSPGLVVAATRAPDREPYLEYTTAMYQGMGSRVCWDALSVHIYPGTSFDGAGSSLGWALNLIRNLANRFGDRASIWITETGATTTGNVGGDGGQTVRSESAQREILRGTVNEMLSAPGIGAVLLNTLRDGPIPSQDPSHLEYGFGLLREAAGPTPPPKPAWCHFAGVVGDRYPGC